MNLPLETFKGRLGPLGSWLGNNPMYRDALLLLSLLILGTLAAVVIDEPWKAGDALPLETVFIDGKELATGAEGVEALRAMARERVQGEIVLKGGGLEHRTTWADIGARAEITSLERILRDLAVPNSPAAKYYRFEAGEPARLELSLPLTLDSGAAVEALVEIKEVLDRAPKDARFNFSKNAVEKETAGRSLDVYGTLERMDEALAHGVTEIEMEVKEVSPEVKASDLMGIDVDTIAGFYETPYSRMKKDRDRTFNVRLGASMLDGQVIMPGELFSFNKTLGDRSQARGFRYAPVIAGGKIVEGMGGGTCQVASTLYAAAFFAGLTIEDRVPHSRPSSYIKLGLDATVSYPSKDLKLSNPLPYPVVIHFTVEDGMARVEIRAKERPFTVSLLRKTIGTTEYPVRVVDDSALAKGKEVVTQKGVPGYKVSRYRIIERNKVAYRFQSFDRYPPTVEFVHRGVGNPQALKDGDKKPPREDTHRPYRASPSLRMVQGPGLWYEKTHN